MSEDNPKEEAADLFLKEMQGVTPIQVKKKVDLVKGRMDKGTVNVRRLAAEKHAPVNVAGFSSMVEVPQVGPQDAVGYKRPGIQDGIFRKLRLGRYEVEARLDLHRLTLEQALNEIKRFIKECLSHDIRTVLVLPGKGDRGQLTPAVLKSHLVYWLKEIDDVQAYHTAQPQDGGTGAFYVLLRKSERLKQLARERIGKGEL